MNGKCSKCEYEQRENTDESAVSSCPLCGSILLKRMDALEYIMTHKKLED